MLLLQSPKYHFHFILRYRHPMVQTKEIVKLQPRTTIIKKHFHHHVTFLVNQSLINQSFVDKKMFLSANRFVQSHTIVQKRYLIQRELKPAIDEYLSQRIEEDRRYYQYHPSEAKRLAASYLQEKTVHQALQHLIPNKRGLVLIPHINVFQRELNYVMRPVAKRQEVAFTYANRMVSDQVSAQQPISNKEWTTQKEIIVEKVEIEHLVKAVYKEIEKRIQQKQQRKGR